MLLRYYNVIVPRKNEITLCRPRRIAIQ